jgi:hypothetical protein
MRDEQSTRFDVPRAMGMTYWLEKAEVEMKESTGTDSVQN